MNAAKYRVLEEKLNKPEGWDDGSPFSHSFQPLFWFSCHGNSFIIDPTPNSDKAALYCKECKHLENAQLFHTDTSSQFQH